MDNEYQEGWNELVDLIMTGCGIPPELLKEGNYSGLTASTYQ